VQVYQIRAEVSDYAFKEESQTGQRIGITLGEGKAEETFIRNRWN
jgi:hypothetical protein